MGKLGKYFTLEELIHTSTGLENNPMASELNNLLHLVENVLDPLRELYRKPIHVNSGYRSPMVNRKVNGATNSDHLFGFAADINGGSKEENKILFELIKQHIPTWRQLINEKDYSWIHISFNPNDNKKQILTIR